MEASDGWSRYTSLIYNQQPGLCKKPNFHKHNSPVLKSKKYYILKKNMFFKETSHENVSQIFKCYHSEKVFNRFDFKQKRYSKKLIFKQKGDLLWPSMIFKGQTLYHEKFASL